MAWKPWRGILRHDCTAHATDGHWDCWHRVGCVDVSAVELGVVPTHRGLWKVCLMYRSLPSYSLTTRRIREASGAHAAERRLISPGMAIALLVTLLFVPWQVAFLGCWIYHLCTCAAGASNTTSSPPANPSIPLIVRRSPSPTSPRSSPPPMPPPTAQAQTASTHNQNTHLLLLLTLLLPLAAPVLAVWVRTLTVTGLTAPWNGDHNILCVAPALMLVERAGEGERIYRGR